MVIRPGGSRYGSLGTGAAPSHGKARMRPTLTWRTIMATSALRHPAIEPAHPGEFLSEINIPATGKRKAELARLLGISRQTLNDILNQKQPETPAIADRLCNLVGVGAGIWSWIQAVHDTWHADRDIDVSDIPSLDIAEHCL